MLNSIRSGMQGINANPILYAANCIVFILKFSNAIANCQKCRIGYSAIAIDASACHLDCKKAFTLHYMLHVKFN